MSYVSLYAIARGRGRQLQGGGASYRWGGGQSMMMLPVDSRHTARRDMICCTFAHATSCPPQIVSITRAAHCYGRFHQKGFECRGGWWEGEVDNGDNGKGKWWWRYHCWLRGCGWRRHCDGWTYDDNDNGYRMRATTTTMTMA